MSVSPVEQRVNPEYVIFDVDGLMIDSERVYTIATNEVLSRYGKEMTWDMKVGCMGKPERQAGLHTLSFFPDIPLTLEEFLVERNRIQDTLWSTVSLLPGVKKLVFHLKKHGVPMAIATSSRRRNFEMKTAHLQDVFSLFDGKIVCADDPQYQMKGKPEADIYLVTATTFLGQDVGHPDEIPRTHQLEARSKGLVFEDAYPGLQAGKRAGMSVVWVPDPNLLDIVRIPRIFTPDEVLGSLDEFKPEEWGLPPYDE